MPSTPTLERGPSGRGQADRLARAAVLLAVLFGAGILWATGSLTSPRGVLWPATSPGGTLGTDQATALLLDAIVAANPGRVTVFVAGDNAYNNGTLTDYSSYYDPTWGRHKVITRPVPGNHEYNTVGAAGYFAYFGVAAGDPTKGYYAYNLGTWRVYALNSEIAHGPGSAQEQWLRADLAASLSRSRAAPTRTRARTSSATESRDRRRGVERLGHRLPGRLPIPALRRARANHDARGALRSIISARIGQQSIARWTSWARPPSIGSAGRIGYRQSSSAIRSGTRSPHSP